MKNILTLILAIFLVQGTIAANTIIGNSSLEIVEKKPKQKKEKKAKKGKKAKKSKSEEDTDEGSED